MGLFSRFFCSGLVQENVICGVGHAQEASHRVTCAVALAAFGVDPLHGGNVGQYAAAAMGSCVELQPRDVSGGSTWGAGRDLAGYGAAVAVFPARAGLVAGG